jgi:hypothetical protein
MRGRLVPVENGCCYSLLPEAPRMLRRSDPVAAKDSHVASECGHRMAHSQLPDQRLTALPECRQLLHAACLDPAKYSHHADAGWQQSPVRDGLPDTFESS